jgi:hypothetical protein
MIKLPSRKCNPSLPCMCFCRAVSYSVLWLCTNRTGKSLRMSSRNDDGQTYGGAQRPSRLLMEGGALLSGNREKTSPPKPGRSCYDSEHTSGYRWVQKLGRGLLPSPLAPDFYTRLADRFLPDTKKAPQHVLTDSLRCLVDLFLPCGGQYDQRMYYAQYDMMVIYEPGFKTAHNLLQHPLACSSSDLADFWMDYIFWHFHGTGLYCIDVCM